MLVKDDNKEDFVEAVRQGCCGIVPKQTSTELLLKSIRKVHAGEFWLDRMTTADVIRRLRKRVGRQWRVARLGVRDQSAALSQREREIVVLVAQGFKNKEMAERMFISEQTVKNHLHNIFDKLGVSDRLELALYAIHHNLHEALSFELVYSRGRDPQRPHLPVQIASLQPQQFRGPAHISARLFQLPQM